MAKLKDPYADYGYGMPRMQDGLGDQFGGPEGFPDYYNNPANGGGVASPPRGPDATIKPTKGGFDYGWDFGAHQNVGSNIKTPKYMLSNYLISNNIDPNSDWSQGAYDHLNSLGVQGLQMNGGKRLSFGDEFVDTTKQAGQFFWGSNPGSDKGPGGMPGSSNPGMFAPTQFGAVGGGLNTSGGGSGGSGGINDAIMSIIKQGYGPDKGNIAKRYESARETLDRGRKSQMSNLQAAMAERGLLGSGAEAATMGRVESDLAGQYSTALRDATLAEDQIASDRFMGAINAGLGSEANDIQRQKVMGELAVAQLSNNRAWNQFMMQYGLDKQKIEYDMQNGNIRQYMDLIKMFLDSGADLSNGQEA